MFESLRGGAILIILCAVASATAVSVAAGISADAPPQLASLLSREISQNFPGAKGELIGKVSWTAEAPEGNVDSAKIIAETRPGEIRFTAHKGTASFEGFTSFSAKRLVWVAQKRIMPGERLSPEAFALREVDVTTGMGREYRGVLLSHETDIGSLESRQTILEGQFALSSAVKKVPDIRRGDVVRIQIQSGGIKLSVMGSAEEPAYFDDQVRVITAKTKKVLVGKLMKDGMVEVRL